ncbi:uncharacterized protein [Clytia hemisphaerica]|uniref:uncharacterized protein n=1 Tax=Clytia hemisphaerica TaxID=252671 RepID=UPI0034D538F5
MDWRSYAILLFCFYFLYLPLVAKTHLLPEDLISDDAEQLEREKRDGFFERIFSFFNNKHEKEEEELEKEEDESQNEKVQDVLKDDDITASFRGYSLPEINLPFTDSSTRETLFTDSTWEAKPTSYTSTLQNTKIFTESTQVGSSSSMSLPTLKLSTAKTPKTIQMLNSVQATPYIASSTEVMTHTKIPEPTSSQFIRSSIKISPTPSRTIEISTTSMAELPAFVDMNVVLADGPRIPDERAYGDVFAQAPQENTVEKSAQAKVGDILSSPV